MRKIYVVLLGFFVTLILVPACVPIKEKAPQTLWISSYYAGWMQGCGSARHLSPDEIDYSALTHILHFAIVPNSDGSIDYLTKCISPENSYNLVTEAHFAGKKVLISVGGWLTESQFLDATNDINRAKFIKNLINFMISRGYDGIDIDWEPISPSSFLQYRKFIIELREALDKLTPRPLLTAAVKKQHLLFAELQDKFDQINIMSYALSGPRPGWITWHNASIYDGGYRFPTSGAPVPSANGLVEDFIEAGVKKNKLGVGIAFFGYVWSGGEGTPTGGVTAPRQKWTVTPSAQEIPYYEIMDNYYHPTNYRWDGTAKAAYLSIDNDGALDDKFISYDDETSCSEKIQYVKKKGLGGIMIFELGGGWRPKASVPDSLLKTVKEAVGNLSEYMPSKNK